MEALLQVEETFLITGRGLVLAPPLRVLSTRNFKTLRGLRGRVQVTQPHGHVTELDAVFSLEHYLKVGDGSGWDIVVILPNASKGDVPVGSRVVAPEDILRVIQGAQDLR